MRDDRYDRPTSRDYAVIGRMREEIFEAAMRHITIDDGPDGSIQIHSRMIASGSTHLIPRLKLFLAEQEVDWVMSAGRLDK